MRTLRKALPFAVLAIASAVCVLGQAPSPPPSGDGMESYSVLHNFLEIPPVPGRPFTAMAVVELERFNVEEGEDPLSRTLSLVARDGKGRTHNEVRRLMPESFHGTPQILVVRLFDPETHTEITYDPRARTGTRQNRMEPTQKAFLAGQDVKTEDLGVSTLNGLETKGIRHWIAITTGAAWWKKSAQVEEETWTAEDLHLNLLVKRSDERAGSMTVGISNLKREEPPATMFEVPPGIRLQDLTTVTGASPPATSGDAGAKH